MVDCGVSILNVRRSQVAAAGTVAAAAAAGMEVAAAVTVAAVAAMVARAAAAAAARAMSRMVVVAVGRPRGFRDQDCHHHATVETCLTVGTRTHHTTC